MWTLSIPLYQWIATFFNFFWNGANLKPKSPTNNLQKKIHTVTEPKTENKLNKREEKLTKEEKQKQGEGISNENLTSI